MFLFLYHFIDFVYPLSIVTVFGFLNFLNFEFPHFFSFHHEMKKNQEIQNSRNVKIQKYSRKSNTACSHDVNMLCCSFYCITGLVMYFQKKRIYDCAMGDQRRPSATVIDSAIIRNVHSFTATSGRSLCKYTQCSYHCNSLVTEATCVSLSNEVW